jgi:hypothetical protein
MGVFPTTGCSIQAAKYTDAEKDLIQTVMDGNAFANPVKGSMDATNTSISETQSLLNSVAWPNLPQWSALSASISSLSSQIGSYNTHSNRISGKSLNALGPNNEPGFMGLYGIASANNNARESILEKNEDNFSPIFNSILGPASSVLNSVNDTINNSVKDLISLNLGVTSSGYPGGFTSAVAEVQTLINDASTSVANLITEDNSSYTSALRYVEKFSLGNMIMSSTQDPCFGGKCMDSVLTPGVKAKLEIVESEKNPT